MKRTDVFTPNKAPGVTFVEDQLKERKRILLDALEMGAAVISLSGPSKSGKTVFIEKTIEKHRLLQVTGAGIDSSKKLWDRVLDLIGVPVSFTTTDKETFQGGVSGKVEAGAKFIVGAKAEAGVSGTFSRDRSETDAYSPDYLQLLIRELGGQHFVVFIDDFHYIPREVQVDVANQIKEAIREGVLFICAAVPYRSDDVIRANPDLRGRMVKLDFDYWDHDALKKIAIRGFAALNVSISKAVIDALASEAAGSPQLMQALCLNICFEENIVERQERLQTLKADLGLIERVCSRTAAMTDYSSTVEKMKDGPKTLAQERRAYLLRDGSIRDVYYIVLKAIALNPPELTIRYQNMENRLTSLCSAETPSRSVVTAACAYMLSVANDAENKVVGEWDGENDVLDVRDPYFLFYLRWADLD